MVNMVTWVFKHARAGAHAHARVIHNFRATYHGDHAQPHETS